MDIPLGILVAGDKGFKSINVDVDNLKVTIYHVSEIAGAKYQCRTVLDYKECNQFIMLQHAAKNDVITLRRQKNFLNARESEASSLIDLVVDVAEMHEKGESSKVDKVDKAKKLLAKMSPEEKAAFLDSL